MPGIDECLLEAMSLPGARGAWLVDWTSGLALGSAGESPVGDHETTAAESAELARAAAEFESPAGEPTTVGPATAELAAPPVEDLIVTTRVGYHVIRFVETDFDSSVFLHVWLDRSTGNLALARIRLGDLAERLVLG
ncbi:roadblock/LC7 domain-containing protein [Streptomyces sp. NPDC004787]|uniref:roadblock/LC7 domain-containing protein n=1 Tax=Streptomyces sp. NPDC004787 TaxID=3154291 RepID=UPI0033B31277